MPKKYLLWQNGVFMKKLGFGTMRLPLINPEDKTSIDQNYFNQLADKFIEKDLIILIQHILIIMKI